MANNRVKSTNDLELKDRLVAINRVTKVTKGGRTFSFAAIVVVGNVAFAMETAGKICPPVPPPLMMILSSFSIIILSSIRCSPFTVHHSPFIVYRPCSPFIDIIFIFKLGVAVQNLCCRFGSRLCFGICGICFNLQLKLCIMLFLFFQMSGISAHA